MTNKLIYIECEAENAPVFKVNKRGDYVEYGEGNAYDRYIIDLYQKSPENNAIINSKANFVAGKGLSYTKTNDPAIDGKLEKFLSYANQFEKWNDLLPKISLNYELIDGFYLQFIFGKNGKIVSTYHIPTSRIRRDSEMNGFWYCEDWSSAKARESKKWYPEYNEVLKTGSCIYYHKVDKPSLDRYSDVYSIPNYTGALNAIETSIYIDIFLNSFAKGGMSAQGMLNLFNGEPANEEEAREIERQFKKKFTGARNAGGFMLNFVNADGKAAEVTNLSASDLEKTFELTDKRCIQKITAGHRIDPVLIGIDNATSWTRTNIIDKWERFQNEYVTNRQEAILSVIKIVADSNNVASDLLFIEPLPPLGEELELGETTFNEVLTIEEKRQYLRDRKGVELSSIDDEQANSRLSVAQKLGVGSTATLQQLILDSTITDVNQKLNILVGLYGIPEKKARKMLGMVVLPVAMSAEKDPILEALLACAIPDNDDEIVEEKFLDCSPDEYEKKQAFKFADILTGSLKEIRNKILDLLAGDPYIKPEIIAKQLGTDVDYVNEQLSELQSQKIIEASGAGYNLTVKGLNRASDVDPVVETEIYTVYKYALSPNADYKNSAGYKDTSHEFCIEMMKKSNSGSSWTRDKIDSLSNDFGEDAWVYRGGWTGRKGGDVTRYCNHVWKAITKVRRKKNG